MLCFGKRLFCRAAGEQMSLGRVLVLKPIGADLSADR